MQFMYYSEKNKPLRKSSIPLLKLHAMITRAPSRPSTPLSCGLGLLALPFRFDKKPSIPDGFCFGGGTVADLSAKVVHDPASSNTICTPPAGDSFLIPGFLPLVVVRGRPGSNMLS
jgi:hypothetical protein